MYSFIRADLMDTNQGNPSKHSIIITINDDCFLQCYGNLIVAKLGNGDTLLSEQHWRGSDTVNKYRCRFLGELGKDTLNKIDKGIYKLVDFNNIIIGI